MRRRSTVIACVLIGSAAGAGPPAAPLRNTAPKPEMKKIDNDRFSFLVPTKLKKTDARGIDSFVEEYAGDGMELDFDYGAYSNDLDDWGKSGRSRHVETVQVGGHPARLVTATLASDSPFRYEAGIHIVLPRQGNWPTSLTMTIGCKTDADLALARQTLMSITFKP